MHKSIRVKLFILFLTTTFLIVSGMYVFMRWSLHQGFNEFINHRQQERVNHLIEELTDFYSKQQSWDKLASDKKKWIDLLIQTNPRRMSGSWLNQALSEPNDVWPPELTAEQTNPNFKPLELRVMLFDADKQIIFGRKTALPDLSFIPIKFNDHDVGYIGLLPGKAPNQVSEARFLESQSQAFIWIALAMICLSAGLAALLAYLFGKRLKRVTNAAQALAVGQYEFRLPVDSRDELGQLARNFNDLAAALEQSEQARRRWVADISHELRTPLAVLRGELEALQDGIRPLNATAIDSLFGDVMRLNRLTEDLYQLSLSDQGGLSYRKTHLDPVEILKDDLDSLQTEFQNKHITVTLSNKLPETAKIYADPDRLSQLFRNLLKNSANYTSEHGQLSMSICRKNQYLQINFSDSSPGVPEQELPKLFERFYRADSSQISNQKGAGLGLAICRNIVEAHNGSIQALPSPLLGLTIDMEFPLSS